MEPKEFVENFAAQFEETEPSAFSIDTHFRSIDEWSSMIALSVIAMVDEAYGVKLTGDDIRSSQTLEDIYNIVKSKL